MLAWRGRRRPRSLPGLSSCPCVFVVNPPYNQKIRTFLPWIPSSLRGPDVAYTAQWMIGDLLLMAAQSESELEALVRDHAQLVFRIAYSVLRNHADAEDATQETFLRAVRHRAKLREIQEPKAWLARIAWRVAIDRKRMGTPASLDDVEGTEGAAA